MVIQLNSTNPAKGTGICLGKKDGAQLTDTLSLGWIELTYSNGAPYGSHCKGEGRVSRIFFFCDSAAGDVSGPSNTPHVGVLCQWPAHHECMLHSDQGVRYDSCHLDCLHKLKSE